MYASSTFIFSAIIAFARLATATPPACLIGAIGVQSNPADLKALCGTLESQVVGNITEKCEGDNLSAAQSAFSSTCLASESVTISFTTSSASSSKTGSASLTTTTSGTKTTATGSSKSTGTAGAASTASSTVSSSGSTASETGKNAGSLLAPQSAFVMFPLVVVAAFASQYFM